MPDGMPPAARAAFCRRLGIRPNRADPSEVDASIAVIAGPVAVQLLRHLSLAIDSPGDLLVWAREIETNPAVLTAAVSEQPGGVR